MLCPLNLEKYYELSVQIVPVSTDCAPLLAAYEAEFVRKLLRDNNKKLAVLSMVSYQSTIINFTIMSIRNKGHHRILQICFISKYFAYY
jgi:chromosome segregation and condensation protein ScpB